MQWAGAVPPQNVVAGSEGMAIPHLLCARSGPTAASAAPTATSTRTWCRRWTRRPCAPAWCERHRPCSASARCTGGCTGWAHGECWAFPCPPAASHPLPYSVTSVFFGGGTPSLASPGTIAAVLEAVAGAAHLPAGAEVTLEANPSSTSTSRLAGFRAAGVNRLSIGVQVRGALPAAAPTASGTPLPPCSLCSRWMMPS